MACFIFYVTAEYRLPVAPVLILGAAYLLTSWHTAWKKGPKSHLIKSALVALIIAIPVNYQTTFAKGLTHKRIDYFNFGTLYKREGNYPKAEQLFLKAVQIDPGFALGHRALAEVYRHRGKIDAMLAADRQAQLFEKGLHAVQDPMQQALAAFANQQYDTALKYFQQAINNTDPRPEH